ncbi:ArsA-related P-loop ATPase [Streptomyces sp. NPDC005438]|uniref:ArsA family ATPase n=1 Tax=Streptomyces sp. NPDC005438 TaxID=3156880 RepID=UPI0033ABB8F7
MVTGLGGAGRTTVAAATAWAEARAGGGRRVLLLSPAPWTRLAPLLELADAPATSPPPARAPWSAERPSALPGLTVARLDPAAGERRQVERLTEPGHALWEVLGTAPLAEEEVTPLPGAHTLYWLGVLAHTATLADTTVVLDLPPLPETLRLLALPEQLRRYLARLLPAERQAARALRPLLAQLVGVPMPAPWLYETAARWDATLAHAQSTVEAPATRVRLVTEPGPHVVEPLRSARAGLALLQSRCDALVANRVLPPHAGEEPLRSLRRQQDAALGELERLAPTVRLPQLGLAPGTAEELEPLVRELAGVAGERPPRHRVEDRLTSEGRLVWHIPLPGAVREEVDLVRRGDELFLTVGPVRRALPLPSALRRCTVVGAALTEGELRVRCEPDPGLWPRGD